MELPSSKSAIVLLGLIVIASGCASNSDQGVTVSQTQGVTIDSFSATPSQVFESQLVTIELQLRNTGGTEAENVIAKLYNVPFEGDRSWDIQSPSQGQERISFNSLRAPNPDTDAPAVSVPRTWSVKAPDLKQGVTIPYDFYTRVFYQYNTTGTAEIRAMSDQRFRESGATRQKPSLDNSGAPIQMEIKTRTPLIFYENSDQQRSDVCVVVKNAGSGTPFLQSAYDSGTQNYGITDQNVDKVKLNLRTSGTVSVEDSTEKTVPMVGGRGVKCFTLGVERVSSQDIQQTIPITVTAEYGYYQDTSTSVTVDGRKGSSGNSNDGGGSNSESDPSSGDLSNQLENELG